MPAVAMIGASPGRTMQAEAPTMPLATKAVRAARSEYSTVAAHARQLSRARWTEVPTRLRWISTSYWASVHASGSAIGSSSAATDRVEYAQKVLTKNAVDVALGEAACAQRRRDIARF